MRHLVLFCSLLFGYSASVFANCSVVRTYGANMGYIPETTLQPISEATDMRQVRCFKHAQQMGQLDVQKNPRQIQLEHDRSLLFSTAQTPELLPVERTKPSLKIEGTGYTIRFRRKSVSISWTF